MSIEFSINATNITKDIFLDVASCIKNEFTLSEISEADNSLWIPSSSPNWIAFSIELTADGFFVVSNLNRLERERIFSLIEKKLFALGIDFNVEDE